MVLAFLLAFGMTVSAAGNAGATKEPAEPEIRNAEEEKTEEAEQSVSVLPEVRQSENTVNPVAPHTGHCFCGGALSGATGEAAKKHTCDPSLTDSWVPLSASMPVTANTTSYYYLEQDTTFSAQKTLGKNQKVYICLNGYTLSCAGKLFLLGYNGNCELYICDCKGTGKVVNTNNAWLNHSSIAQFYWTKDATYDAGGSVRMDIFGGTFIGSPAPNGDKNQAGGISQISYGELNVFGGDFRPNEDAGTGALYPNGGCFYVSGGTLNFYNGTISGFTGNAGGGVMVTGGTFNMYGGTIENNTAYGKVGGNIYINGGTANLSGGTIQNGTASTGGRNIYHSGAGVLNLGGVSLISDTTTTVTYGANLYSTGLTGSGAVNMTGGTIQGGKSTSGGSLMIGDNGKFNMSGGKIVGGISTGTGGNIGTWSGATLVFSGGEVLDGKSVNEGGNFYTTGNLTIKDNAIFAGGQAGYLGASKTGGNIYINSGSTKTLSLTGGTLTDGKATWGGNFYTGSRDIVFDGIHIGTEVTLSDGTKRSGGTAAKGGNLYVPDKRTYTINAPTVIENGTATGAGGGGNIFIASSTLIINGGEIKNGKATGAQGYGGNIYLSVADSKCTLNQGTISGGTAVSGGSIMVAYGQFTMENGTIDGGTATNTNGGNISMWGNDTTLVRINGGTIQNGKATKGTADAKGGNLFVSADTEIKNATIQGGSAFIGGNIAFWKTSVQESVTVSDTVIKDGVTNTSGTTQGANISVEGSTVIFNNCTVADGHNKGGGNGGNLYMAVGGDINPSVTINGGSFLRGRGKYSGTNIYVSAGYLTVNKGKDESIPVFQEGALDSPGTTTARNIVFGSKATGAALNSGFFLGSDSTVNLYTGAALQSLVTVKDCYFVGRAFSMASMLKNGVKDSYFTNKNVAVADLYDDPATEAVPYIRDLGTEGGVTVKETYFRYKSSEGYTLMLQAAAIEGDIVSVTGLSGAGIYDPSEQVSVSALQESNGYRFVQWNDENGTKLTGERELQVTMDEEKTLVAVYQYGLETLNFKVSGTKLDIEKPDKTHASGENEVTISSAERGTYVLTYTDMARDFMYWEDENGNILSKANPFTYELTNDAALTAVSTEKEKSVVLFRSLYGQIIKSFSGIDELNAESVTAPTVPYLPGKGGKWTFTDGTEFSAAILASKLIAGETLEIIPEYTDLLDQDFTVTLYLVNLTGKDAPEVSDLQKTNVLATEDASVGEIVTVSGTGTGTLLGIFGSDAVRLSMSDTLSFRALNKETNSFFLVYTDEAVTNETAVGISEFSSVLQDNGKHTLKISVNYETDETVIERGVLYTFDSKLPTKSKAVAEAALYKGSADAFAYVPATVSASGSVTLLLKNITDIEMNFYARGYVIYKLADGTEAIRYSEVRSGNIETTGEFTVEEIPVKCDHWVDGDPSTVRLDWYESKVAEYEQEELLPTQKILFAGDSWLTRWTETYNVTPKNKNLKDQVKADDGPVVAINRGIGGGTLHEIWYFYDRLIKQYSPEVLVLCCHLNDLGYGYTNEEMMLLTKTICENARIDMPGIKIYLVNYRPTVSTYTGAKLAQVLDFNERLQAYADANSDTSVIDMRYQAMFYKDAASIGTYSNTDPTKYVDDGVHPTSAAYDELAEIFKSALSEYLD